MNIKLSIYAFGILLLFVLALGFIIGRHTNFLASAGAQQDTTDTFIDITPGDVDPNFEAKPDTIWKTKWKHLPANIDSLQAQAMQYWESIYGDSLKELSNIVFLASIDTTFQDSVLIFNASYVSPIPLHPASFFRFGNLSVKQKEIHTVETKEIYWYDKINIGIGMEGRWLDWKLRSRFYGQLTYKALNMKNFEIPIRLQLYNDLDGAVMIETQLKF